MRIRFGAFAEKLHVQGPFFFSLSRWNYGKLDGLPEQGRGGDANALRMGNHFHALTKKAVEGFRSVWCVSFLRLPFS